MRGITERMRTFLLWLAFALLFLFAIYTIFGEEILEIVDSMPKGLTNFMDATDFIWGSIKASKTAP